MFKLQKIWRLITTAALLASALNLSILPATPVQALSSDLVISQVYGGAGCTTAGCSTYKNDYIEIFNRGASSVSLSGLSVQYASAAGSFNAVVATLSGSLAPGQYYLVAAAFNTNGVNTLPTPDVTGTTAMSAAAGKVALVTGTTALACGATGTTPAPCSSTQLAQIIDLVGYGTTATMFEGSSYAPAPSTTNAVFRGTLGCSETDNNNTDFTAAPAAPRNSAATKNPCGPVLPILSINDVSLAEGNAGTTTFTFTVSLSSPAPAGGVTFDITTADGTATIADNDYVGRTLTGQSIAEASNSFSFDVTVNGDTNAELNETFFVNVTNVSSGVTVGDGQGQGTITNDDAILPVLSINDVTITEGNSGTGTASFTVSLSSPALAGGVTFDIATADGTATVADNDYAGRTLTGQSIAEAGNSFSFDVTVNGDTKPEGNETFFVNITNVSGAAVSDAQGLGTIVNDDLTPIYTIQGSGAATTLTGSVITEGIVVGDYEGGVSPQIRGFFIQDAVGDGNPATSDGLFVYNGSNNNVALGDLVRVTGTVSEYQGQTQISATAITIINSANTLAPTDISLPFASVADQERYEGMLVRVSQPLYVTEHYQLGRFGQVTLSGSGKLYQPTNIVLPGAAALAMQASNDLNKIILDDATNTENPDPIVFGRGGNPLSASNTLRGGDTITGLVGVFTYSWGGNSSSPNAYRIRPINTLGGGIPNFAADNARPSTPTSIGGTVKVAGFNLLNYFNTFADGNSGTPGCYPSGTDADCRGAESAIEFTRQSDKTVNAILAMNVDVIGIAEMENDGYGADSAIQDLVNKLNAATAPGTYAFINPDTTNGAYSLGTDGIKVGLLYKTTTVTPVGTTAVLNSAAFVNGGDTVARNRVSLLQAFETPTGERFIANINHFKSKGSCPAAGTNPGNEDAGDGQSCWNLVRINAANALTTWFGTDPTGTGDPDIVILGDLNSYAMEDPIAALESEHYTNLVKHFGGTSTYSYVFDGQWGYLDYALGSPRLLAQTTGVTEFHINSDEPSILDYNTNYKTAGQIISLYSSDPFRTGDHDPIIVGLNLNSLTPGAPTDITLSNSSIAENQLSGTLVGNLSSTDQNPSDTFTYSFCGGTDDGSFQISGSQLQSNAVFNYEVKNSYSICIRSTDSGSLFFDKTLPITITDANETPTNLGLSNSSVAENQLIGTLVGNLSTTDPDAGDTFTYSFCGGTDDGSFQISGSQLQTNAVFNYEVKNSYSICIRSTDSGSLFFDKTLPITITDANETPTNLGLSNSSVAENQLVGTLVGNLSTIDPDAGDTFTYSFCGGTNDSSFKISGNQLQTNAVFDYETKNSYSICVRSTDSGSLFFDKTLPITITDANDAPTNIALSNNTVTENLPIGTLVGNLSTVDINLGDTFTYSFCGGADDASFTIAGTALRTAAMFDFETKAAYNICVRTDDGNGGTFDKAFTVNVTDVPGLELLTPANAENLPYNRPTFDWVDYPAAIGYQIQVSKNLTFTQLVTNATIRTATSNYTPTLNLATNATLFWRVRARLTLFTYSPWSEIRRFHTANPPGVPSLVSPFNNALLTDTTPTLDWNQPTVPAGVIFDHYQIQVDDNADFSSPVVDANVDGLGNSLYTLTTPLNPNTKYYWHVRSWNDLGEYSAWSTARYFREAMLPPKLTAPISGVTVGSLKPLLDWDIVLGATSYTVQVSITNTFTTLRVNAMVLAPNTFFTPHVNLPAGTVLYWRVRSNGPNGPSDWSVFETFVTP